MAPRVLHLSTYDANGGAGRAAYALHRAMVNHGIPSRMHVARKATNDPTVTEGDRRPFLLASEADRALWKLQRSPNTTWRSPARFGSLTADQINRSSADIINLHWVTDGFLSIETIGKIEKPIVWSMYDMWPFTGTEHYVNETPDARWRTGYTTANRPTDESGLDLDRWTFTRKQRSWPPRDLPIHMVPASSWLQRATTSSALMHGWPVTRIPHIVDLDVFAPMSKEQARTRLRLPQNVPMILFLASAGIIDRRKGWDLLEQALPQVATQHSELHVAIAGPVTPDYRAPAGTTITWLGRLDGNEALRLAYCAADVLAVPSREDNLPLTAMEAQSCGRPVVAYNLGGLPDIVDHQATGFLANPDDASDLALGLTTTLNAARTSDELGSRARERAEDTWSPAVIVDAYMQLCEQTCS